MDEKQAKYIVAILGLWNSSPQGIFWKEATETDFAQYEEILEKYQERKWNGSFHAAMNSAKVEFILKIANEGLPEGATIPAGYY